MSLAAAVLLVGLAASAAASIAGAGIGSTLAPLISLQVGLKLAIAATAIPHLCASVIRFGLSYKQIDRLVGEQGGFRSVALLGFHVPKETFIATATAIGLIVDVARVPVYLLSQGPQLLAIWPLIGLASTAVIIGTLIGYRFLQAVPEAAFSRVVSGIILIIGCLMLV